MDVIEKPTQRALKKTQTFDPAAQEQDRESTYKNPHQSENMNDKWRWQRTNHELTTELSGKETTWRLKRRIGR
jgi:hypothetical protein